MNSIIRKSRFHFAIWSVLCAPSVLACGVDPGTGDVGAASNALTTSNAMLKVGLADSFTGSLMPFGGLNGTCLSVTGSGLEVAACRSTSANQITLVQAGTYVYLKTASGLCVDIFDGNESTGAIDVTTCNGSINQKWLVSGGQIQSANTSENTSHANNYCLDILDGNTTLGAVVDLAPCNQTAAQEFWTAGYTIGIESTLFDSNNYEHPECLDVLGNNENSGATLDDSDCNGTNAQWFVLNQSHQITLASDQNLCVAAVGAQVNGTTVVELESCDLSVLGQQWHMLNKSVNSGCSSGEYAGCSEFSASNFVNDVGCLDIYSDSSKSPTTVDDYTCTPNNQAQLWVPFTPFNQPIWNGPTP
jgi:hypothetical protein